MRTIFIVLIIIVSCCKFPSEKTAVDTSIIQRDTASSNDYRDRTEHIRDAFYVGNIGPDNQSDSAIVEYDVIVHADNSIEECVNSSCDMVITFSNQIPDLTIYQSLGVYIEQATDVNNNHFNEMLVYSRWYNGCWQQLNIFTLKDNHWISLASTKAFLSEDEDWKNRIVKKNNRFYLLGDDWDTDFGTILKRSVKIEIKDK